MNQVITNHGSFSWRRYRACRLEIIAFAILLLMIPTQVFGVLGGSEASVQADQAHLQASLQSTAGARYTVHELRTPTGVVVREYVAGGTVFAIAWKGPWPPDMNQLLGSYFATYQQVLQAQSGNRPVRRPIHIQLPELVVRANGHPRSFIGHAYLPDLLPQGVKPEEIR